MVSCSTRPAAIPPSAPSATQGDKFVLNGRPYQLRMLLDQGYWPDTGDHRAR